MPLSRLKKYLEAYNIDIGRVFEKDDLIEVILKARMHNGCLSPENEDYYRNYSVPDRSTSHTRSTFFGRSAGQSSNRSPAPPPRPPSNTRPYDFPRPDLESNLPRHQPHAPYSGPPPPPRQTRPSYQSPPPIPPRPSHQAPPHHHHHQYSHPSPPPPPPQASRPAGYPQYQRPSAARSTENLRRQSPQQPRQRAASAAPPAAAPPPTLDQLLDMSDDSIKSLSIGALKSILFTNHVNARQILEKGDLIVKVKSLIEDERRDRERQRALQEAEEQEAMERQRVMMEEHRRAQERERERPKADQGQADTGAAAERSGFVVSECQGESAATQNQETEESSQSSTPSTALAPPSKSPPKTRGTVADLERTGLCVICQDEEANIAIVDCGYVFAQLSAVLF
ncbi:hypothetical protein C0989_011232 [Termitomyces sp. Mn162]|nr:hypothetical protein C0989_011232 [Termitomyces sp. Mn162]